MVRVTMHVPPGPTRDATVDIVEAAAIDHLSVQGVEREGTASVICTKATRPIWFWPISLLLFPVGLFIGLAVGKSRTVSLCQFAVSEGPDGCRVESSGPHVMAQYTVLLGTVDRLLEHELINAADHERLHGHLMAGEEVV